MRTTSVSILLLLVGAGGACSSKSTDNGNAGGNGGIIGGGGGTPQAGTGTGNSGTGNTGNTSAGGTSNGGTGNTSAGGSSSGGTSAGTAGISGAAQQCEDAPVVCLDDDTASTCNPDTLMDESITCSTGIAALGPGLISKGCITDAEGSGCSIGFEDEACAEGAPAYAACSRSAGVPIEDLQAYFYCFSDTEGSKAFIPCFADFVDEAARTVDCMAAEPACFPEQAGGAGAGGAGD